MSVFSAKNVQSLVTDISGLSLIVALCYYAGYVSWISFYRLLGADVEGQALDYLKMGGDFFISSILNAIRFIAHSPFQAIGSLGMAEVALPAILIAIAILVSFGIRLFFPKSVKMYWIGLVLAAISGLGLLHQQARALEVDNLLHISPANIFTKYADTDVPVCERNASIYEGYFSDLQVTSPIKHQLTERFFNMLSSDDNAFRRFRLYVAFCLVIGIQVLFFFYLAPRPARLSHQILLILPTLFCLLLLPASYGIFGRSYAFPVVTLDLETKETPVRTHAVYLIGQNEKQYCLYDKYNFFQIKYIPRDRVKGLHQLFKASPFDAAIPNQPALCDSILSIPANQNILDF